MSLKVEIGMHYNICMIKLRRVNTAVGCQGKRTIKTSISCI
jgi:hypothetical protein